MTKEVFGVETFLVWHAMVGYWGGVDGKALPGYEVRTERRDWSPGILSYYPNMNEKWGNQVGVIPPEEIYRFFQDYHRHLRLQGVDGVKVDNQAVLEAVAKGSGGRVAMMRQYHEALEGSVQAHFQGNLINCMSNANEMIYSALSSTLMRSSIDFWPNIREFTRHPPVCQRPGWNVVWRIHSTRLGYVPVRSPNGCPACRRPCGERWSSVCIR